MSRLDETTVSEIVADDAPLPDSLLAIAAGALTNLTSMVTVITMPGAEPEHLRHVVEGMMKAAFPKGEGNTVGDLRRSAAAYLRELAERLEPIA